MKRPEKVFQSMSMACRLRVRNGNSPVMVNQNHGELDHSVRISIFAAAV